MAHISGPGIFYFFLLASPLITFIVVSICLLLQISLYYLNSKILSKIYLIFINLIIFPWLVLIALDILGGALSGNWSLFFELLLPTIHLFLFPVASILIHLYHSKNAFHE